MIDYINVLPQHKGVAILINKDYKPHFNDLELFEITRGIWPKGMKTISGDLKYAYATFNGKVVEVYEIYCWVPAGSQEYFTRSLDRSRLATCKWEFVGKKANKDVRELYVGKYINKIRSFGNTFIPVGVKQIIKNHD